MQPRFRNYWKEPLEQESESCPDQADLSLVKKSARGNMEEEKEERQRPQAPEPRPLDEHMVLHRRLRCPWP